MTAAYLGLGSNLGDREESLRRALRLLAQKAGIPAVSSVYETEPWGFANQPLFLNLVCAVETRMAPHVLLELCQEVESRLGRTPTFRYGPRTIDVDILLYGDCVMDTPRLQVPHPRMAQRAFVLVPLAEIAPDLVHPMLKRSVMELLADVEGKDMVVWQGVLPPITAGNGAL
ncbi:MAG: 2-amino-4-hydroxy-6-hydroxymethyldihydropteridine diphosphokinase [Chloroflexi bacterium]|nr:2-amino-4-hydroxy-6-hydroxymethyldihydropteridine diphosphokinase [Chloroflexota bacterium]